MFFCSEEVHPSTFATILAFFFVFLHLLKLQTNRPSLHNSTFSMFPHSLFLTLFSLPPNGFLQPHQDTVNRTAETDLQPSSFHWPPQWQPRFNAVFSLAKARQVNLLLFCDLMPPAFEVSYCSVAHRTQKRCQVAIVKILSLKGGGTGVQ